MNDALVVLDLFTSAQHAADGCIPVASARRPRVQWQSLLYNSPAAETLGGRDETVAYPMPLVPKIMLWRTSHHWSNEWRPARVVLLGLGAPAAGRFPLAAAE